VVYLDQTGSWTTPSGSGTTTNALTISSPLTGTSFNGSSAVTIALASGYGDTQNPYGSKTANYFLAAPDGSAGSPTFRAIVAADIPTLNQNTTGTAANITATSNTTLTTLSSLVSIGTITTGTWNASAIGVAYGGTGLTTLTAGYIPYGAGTSAFGSSANLFWDSANSRLGIGTVSPSEKLSVKSATGINSVTDIASLTNPSQTSAGVRMLFNNGYGNLGAISSFQLDNGAGADNGVLAFQTSSDAVLSTKMTILDTGNVGIGTASPSSALHVARPSGTSTYFQLAQTSIESWQIGMSASSTALAFLNSGTERMRLTDAGLLGIGTASPYNLLEATKSGGATISIANSASGAGIMYGKLSFYSTVAAGAYSEYGGQIRSYSGIGIDYGDLRFYTGNGATTAERVRITSAGDVGIGVIPSAWHSDYKVEQIGLAGSVFNDNYNEDMNIGSNAFADTRGGYKFIRTGYAQRYAQTNSGQHRWFTSSAAGTAGNTITFTERMCIDSSGNVGIGTTSLPEKLSVNGNISANALKGTSTSYNVPNFITPRVSDGNWSFGIHSDDSSTYFMQVKYDGANSATRGFRLYDVGTSSVPFLVTGQGNVGIGTSSPSEKLTVTGNIRASGVYVGNGSTGDWNKGFGGIKLTTTTSTPTGGQSGDFVFIY